MTNLSRDWSDRAALAPLARLLAAVHHETRATPLLLVGAAARDLLLVHAHGVALERATEDTDLALAVPNWDEFLRLRTALIASGGFTPDGPQHRLRFEGQSLDLIPFGGVERADRSVAWPPDGAQVMGVPGFTEAMATAVTVRLLGGISVAVASLPALALLKVWAWQDRKYTTPGKDASDLWLLLRSYADAGNQDRLYGEEAEALTAFGFDLEKAGAWLLGRDGREVLEHGPDPPGAIESLEAILAPEIDVDGALRLVGQMPVGNRDRQLSLLTAFYVGLFETRLSNA